jgi:hypothetical protein
MASVHSGCNRLRRKRHSVVRRCPRCANLPRAEAAPRNDFGFDNVARPVAMAT